MHFFIVYYRNFKNIPELKLKLTIIFAPIKARETKKTEVKHPKVQEKQTWV